jgi:hypothetical protein
MRNKNLNEKLHPRHNERGAALITSIMISTLLLTISGAIILTTSMSATTTIESTAEVQAYYGAESGLEAALNVIRGNVAPQAGMATNVRMGLRNAVSTATANLPTDNSAISSLSGWLPYNNGRVTPAGASYSYSLTVTDPDDPSGTIRATNANYRPDRLVIQSTGFGPRGTIKRMEMVISKSIFNFSPAAMLMMRGASDGSKMTFTIGDSNAKYYSGHDNAGAESDLPAFGTTGPDDEAVALDAITKGATVEDTQTAQVSMSDLPEWLQTTEGPTGARAFLDSMQATAVSMNRYFTSFSGYSGSTAAPVFTFVDGNATLDGGAGVLIVTGDLTLHGNPNFNGIILVLGNGRVLRDGGGNGDILGTIYVAKFARTWPSSEDGMEHPFLTASFETNGAGTSDLKYDSAAVNTAIDVLGTVVRDIREY